MNIDGFVKISLKIYFIVMYDDGVEKFETP